MRKILVTTKKLRGRQVRISSIKFKTRTQSKKKAKQKKNT